VKKVSIRVGNKDAEKKLLLNAVPTVLMSFSRVVVDEI
jgi:hypothetical protein